MTSQYIYFVIFAFLSYLIITDASVAKLVVLLGHIAKFQFQKFQWIVIHHPQTPWARYFMWRQSIRIAKELEKELKNGRID